MTARGTIFVVDDDMAVRQATCWALRAAGFDAVDYESGEAFLRDAVHAEPLMGTAEAMQALALSLQHALFHGSPPARSRSGD